MLARRVSDDMVPVLRRLVTALERVEGRSRDWPLTTDLSRLTRSVEGYLLPRLEHPARPLTVLFSGPTGAGKSTLVNSTAGLDVSVTGELRPTTRRPVALVGPAHAEEDLGLGGVECELVVGEAPILDTMTLIDSPDVDSTETGHRLIAETLIDHADVVVFVTSALRYADAVPWEVLRRAQERGTGLIIVLNRVSPATTGARVDFRSRLHEAGLSDEVVFVPEHHMGPGSSRVPTVLIRSLRKKLASVATARKERAGETLARVLEVTLGQVADLVEQLEMLKARREEFEEELSLDLGNELDSIAVHGVIDGFHEELPDGATGRGLARWLRRNRRRHDEIATLETHLANRVTGLVAAELRRLVDGYEVWPGQPAISAVVGRQVAAALPSESRGWVQFVRRIANAHSDRAWSAEAALVESACTGKVTPEAEVLFGEEAATLVERARRELVGRLHVIGAAIAAEITELAYPGLAEVDLEDLRSAHGAVVARLAPVHA